MAGNQHAGDRDRVKSLGAKALDDDAAGVSNVGFGYLFGGKGLSDWNRAMEIVGVRGAKAGDGAAGLGQEVANSEWVWTMPPIWGNSR